MRPNRLRAKVTMVLTGLALVTLLGGDASAQSVTGALQGRCVSTDDRPEMDVVITLEGSHLQGPRQTRTDRHGFFEFPAVPPGVYALRAERAGLQPVEVGGIVVELRRATSIPALRMTPEPLVMEPVVVRPPEIAIETADTAAGGVLNEADYASLPVDRDYKSLISILPMADASYRGDPVNVAGSTGLENQYYLDGVNVTEPLQGFGGTSLPFNFVRAVEVQTAGYQAQFGRALGAVVNAVTYTGTNDFQLQAFGFIEPNGLQMEARDTGAVTSEGAVSYDVGVRVGGPVIRDRLWYSAAVNPRVTDVDKEIGDYGTFTDRTSAMRYAGKLTWHATQSTTLELSLFGDPTEQDIVDDLLPEVETVENIDPLLASAEFGGNVASLRATVSLSPSLLLETWVSRQRNRDSRAPATARGAAEPYYWDQVEGVISGGNPGHSEGERERTSVTVETTLLVPGHTLTAGVNYEESKNSHDAGGSDSIWRLGESSWYRWQETGWGTTGNRSPTVYVQDNWRINDRFTLSPGLRWSTQDLIGPSGRTLQRISDGWQPRLGFSWQLGPKAGKQRLFGSYGRFNQTLPVSITMNFTDWRYTGSSYSTDPRDPDSTPDSSFYLSESEADWTPIPELEADRLDEFTLGYERIVGRSKLTFRGIHRHLQSSFQVGLDPSLGPLAKVYGTPGQGDLSFLPPPERDYTALEISAVGSWSRARYRASYVLSRTWGNFPGLYNSDLGISNPGFISSFSSPSQAENSTGYLPNDRTHVFKLSGNYATEFGLSVGGILLLESGAPINEWEPGGAWGLATPDFLSERGSAGRTPWLWDLSLRFTYGLPTGPKRPLQLLLDVLHVGNPQRSVWVDEYRITFDDEDNLAPNPDYKQPIAFQPPTALRLGIQAMF